MTLQTLLVLLAAAGAAFHLLRGSLGALRGAGGCAPSACAGCTAACPSRRPAKGRTGLRLSPGRLP